MLERHYSHLDVLHRADKLAGRSEKAVKKQEHRLEQDGPQTKILIVDRLQIPQLLGEQATPVVKQSEEQPAGFAVSPLPHFREGIKTKGFRNEIPTKE
ncbi:MAG: hypothetical protein IT292_03185 [Deltaproteobacteria bacterium]|nr:hypothetical protein [Deltaproteobacteria bacterium]